MAVIREDIVQIKYEVDDSGLKKTTNQINKMKSTLTSAMKNNPFTNLTNGINKATAGIKKMVGTLTSANGANNIVKKISGDIEIFNAGIAVAKDKFSAFKQTIATIKSNPLKTLDDKILAIQMSTGRTVTEFKNLAQTKLSNLHSNITKIKTTLTNGETGAKSFSNALKNIGKISVVRVATGLTNIKTKMQEGITKSKLFISNLKKIDTTSLQSLNGKITALTNKISSGLINAAKKAAITLTALSAAIGGVIYKGVQYNSQMEAYITSFKTMLGDANKAQTFVNDLKVMAAKTPFEMTDLANASQTLLGFGISSEKVMPYLQALGDVSQGNAERFSGLALAFAQVQAAGKLTGQDLLQMINQGFNPLNQISKTTGKSIATLKEEMSKGSISAEMVAQAFQDVTKEGGFFYNAMEAQSKTFNGQISTLKDNVNSFLGDLTKGIQDKLKDGLLPKVNEQLSSISTAFQKGGFRGLLQQFGAIGIAIQKIIDKINKVASNTSTMQGLKNVFTAIKNVVNSIIPIISSLVNKIIEFATSETVLKTIETILNGIGKAIQFCKNNAAILKPVILGLVTGFVAFKTIVVGLTAAISAYNLIVEIMNAKKMMSAGATITETAAQWGLNAALLACPITWIIIGIAALIAIIVVLVVYWDKVKAVALKCWEGIKNIWDKVASWFKTTVIDPVVNFFKGLWSGIVNIFTNIINWIKSNWTTILAFLINPFTGILKLLYDKCTGFRKFVNNILSVIKTFVQNVVSFIVSLSITTWNFISNLCGETTSWVNTNLIQPISNFFKGLWNSITNGVSFVKKTIIKAFSSAFDKVKEVWNKITGFFSGLWNGIKNTVNKLINNGKEATATSSKVKSNDKVTKHALGGLMTTKHIGIVAEAGPEMIIPLSNRKKQRGINLWQQAGHILGMQPNVPKYDLSDINLSGYTPENTSTTNSNFVTTENNSYAPVFNLSIHGNTDRNTERQVKQWIKEALNETFDSMSRKKPRLQQI